MRHFGELVIDEDTAELLVSMSAATIDRRLADERAKYHLKGRASTKPGSLLKSQIPVRTWADWDDARPGFVEIDLVGHDGGNPAGPHAFTLTVTDIATGWTENRSVPDKTGKCVLAALNDIASKMPSRSWGWTRTTDQNSSTSTCSTGAQNARSPSPGPIPTGELVIPENTGPPEANRGLMMPTRRRTRSQDHAYRIALERQRNAARIPRKQFLLAERIALNDEPPPS